MTLMATALLWMAAMVSVMGSVGADSRPLRGTVDGDHLTLTLDRGVRCEGSILKMTKDGGMGSLVCDDGRKGSFNWTITSRGEASGDGWLAGEPLTLTFTQV